MWKRLVFAAAVLLTPDAHAQTCRESVGASRAQAYVTQCLQVSPATHPPCNAANRCELIIDEIRRGCALITGGKPTFCATYQRQP
jgi:hypothetical protein